MLPRAAAGMLVGWSPARSLPGAVLTLPPTTRRALMRFFLLSALASALASAGRLPSVVAASAPVVSDAFSCDAQDSSLVIQMSKHNVALSVLALPAPFHVLNPPCLLGMCEQPAADLCRQQQEGPSVQGAEMSGTKEECFEVSNKFGWGS